MKWIQNLHQHTVKRACYLGKSSLDGKSTDGGMTVGTKQWHMKTKETPTATGPQLGLTMKRALRMTWFTYTPSQLALAFPVGLGELQLLQVVAPLQKMRLLPLAAKVNKRKANFNRFLTVNRFTKKAMTSAKSSEDSISKENKGFTLNIWINVDLEVIKVFPRQVWRQETRLGIHFLLSTGCPGNNTVLVNKTSIAQYK